MAASRRSAAPSGRKGKRVAGAGRDEPTPWRVEGLDKPASPTGTPPPGYRRPRFWLIVLALLAFNWVASGLLRQEQSRLRVPYTVFRGEVDKGNVEEVHSRGETIQGTFKKKVTFPAKGKESSTDFETERPTWAEDNLLAALEDNKVAVNAKPVDEPPSFLAQVLFGFGPTLLLVGLFVLMSRRLATGLGAGGVGGLGRSRARRYQASSTRTTFADVAGIDEAEEELVEVVEFLRQPERYRRLGAMIPRGVLLSGLPGTGKTLLARAVAGEADVPFFSLSASEFVEMIVGVGASRVRDLFEQAKAVAPAIIFIDELDAIGRARSGSSAIGGHDEQEQTLNQILTEMDGFTGTEGVIVLAATNRAEILDPALLRPGRFDRRIIVNPPDQTGREAIMRVHSRNVPMAPDVDLAAIASSTPGMVGADLRNLINEAALLAARRLHDQVTTADFADALEKVVLGAARRILLSAEVRERTAYHESGHALLGMLQPGSDPVRKISIIPRGQALGVTFQSPETDRYSYSETYLRGRITGALGGRAAEETVYGDVTTGAESDLEQVTHIARQMVGRWGMSPAIGPITVLPGPNELPFGASDPTSPETRALVDVEVRRIVDECYQAALATLAANRHRLDDLAQALLTQETLGEQEAYRVAGIPRETNAAAADAVAIPPIPALGTLRADGGLG
jgi:cell division protease FtsH